LVRDSAGQLVGTYLLADESVNGGVFPSDHVFVKAFSTPFAVAFTTSLLGSYSNGGTFLNTLYFASSDCSGTPYFSLDNLPTLTAVTFAGVGGTVAYVMGGPLTNFTPQSQIELKPGSANGACVLTGSGYDNFFPVIATYDLSTLNLVPPFSVQ
jgi:hypothetical protein